MIKHALLAGTIALGPTQAFTEAHAPEHISSAPSITMTLKNTYEGETYAVTSETWVFEQRCDYWDWMEAFGQIAAMEMHDYRVGYSGLSVDVTVRSGTGVTTYHDLNQNQLSGLFINSRHFQGQAIQDHEESFLGKTCFIS